MHARYAIPDEERRRVEVGRSARAGPPGVPPDSLARGDRSVGAKLFWLVEDTHPSTRTFFFPLVLNSFSNQRRRSKVRGRVPSYTFRKPHERLEADRETILGWGWLRRDVAAENRMTHQITAIRYFGLKIQFWPAVLISMLALKIVLSVVLKQGELAATYGGVCYFLFILLATLFSAVNALKNNRDGRIFWTFIAIGCALWLVDQWLFLYYGLVAKSDIPDNSIADPVLFLHIVPFMAAVAFAPHLQSTRLKLYRPALNFLLLLFFWVFLYAYFVFPHQYLFPDSQVYNGRFDFLYRIENLALVLVIGFYCVRGKQPWRPVYLNLFGAGTLYAFSSAFANLAIDAGFYSNRAVYAFGLNASAAWFAWSALRWGKLPEDAPETAETGVHSSGPLWALMVVLAIPLFGIWDLVRQQQSPEIRDVRQLVVLAALVVFAAAAMLKGYFSERELATDARRNLLQTTLSEAAFGASEASRKEIDTLYREFTETVPAIVWRLDPVMLHLISVNDPAKEILGYPVETWTTNPDFWKQTLHPDDRDRVLKLLTRCAAKQRKFDFECRMIAADGRVVWLRTDAKIVRKGGGRPN